MSALDSLSSPDHYCHPTGFSRHTNPVRQLTHSPARHTDDARCLSRVHPVGPGANLAVSPTNTLGPARHYDAHQADIFTQWTIERFQSLCVDGAQPLIVPVTATFKPGSIQPDEVLREFERFYARLCNLLIKNHDRPNKRPLLPFAIAWRDDPRTRPDKYRSRPASDARFFNDPSVAPHVHSVLVIHPQLVDKFMSVADDLGAVWRCIPSFIGSSRDRALIRNGTLHLDLERGERISRGLIAGATDGETARAELDRWLGYSSKLASRRDAGDSDVFTVLPTAA